MLTENRMGSLAWLLACMREMPPLARSQTEMARILDRVCECGPSLNTQLPAEKGRYTRTCAFADDGFEVLLLNWAPGAASAIHDHGDQHCWLAVLEGRLAVDDYVRVDRAERPDRAVVVPDGTAILSRGDVDARSGRFDIHRVAEAGGSGAISLHVYARPLRTFQIYDEFSQRCRPATGKYDAVL